MTVGFVVSDKTRSVVFSAIANGEASLDNVVKRHRLLRPAAERAAKELSAEALIAPAGKGWALTEAGRAVAREMGKKDASHTSG